MSNSKESCLAEGVFWMLVLGTVIEGDLSRDTSLSIMIYGDFCLFSGTFVFIFNSFYFIGGSFKSLFLGNIVTLLEFSNFFNYYNGSSIVFLGIALCF